MGDLQFERADIVWGNLFFTPSRTKIMGFTDWHTMDRYCVLVKEPGYYSKIVSLVLPFDQYTWMGVVFSIVALFSFFMMYAWLHIDR